ncbi:type VI secretion system accessory protein TagJ [Tundrisphaera sp. TA3]|uniref:type VI secretion system accessory protein TagJ n=1 Tax=Tundrisphaera sp. TA3 TaxID=3435775 RepID=UPI003EBCB4B7
MTVDELLSEGKLTQAVARAKADAAEKAGDPAARRLLFDLLCFAGDLAGAEGLLGAPVAAGPADDPVAHAWTTISRSLLEAEKARNRLFGSGVRPRFLDGQPTPAMVPHLEAVDAIRSGGVATARKALDRGSEAMPIVSGTMADGTAFADIRDADDLLAPALEVFAPAGYFWVGWDQIQFLEVATPTTLRDLIWARAKLATFDGQLGEVFLPVLYFGTAYFTEDDPLRLGRKTDWMEAGSGIVRGVGRKVILVGEEGPSVLELGTLQFAAPAGSESTALEGAEPPPDLESPPQGAF